MVETLFCTLCSIEPFLLKIWPLISTIPINTSIYLQAQERYSVYPRGFCLCLYLCICFKQCKHIRGYLSGGKMEALTSQISLLNQLMYTNSKLFKLEQHGNWSSSVFQVVNYCFLCSFCSQWWAGVMAK